MIKIAIDGPSGAGKSSLAKAIADHYKIVYVDTGALYRSIALYVARNKINPYNSDDVCAALPNVKLELRFADGFQRVYLCGEDVSDHIRTPEISSYASTVSAIPAVREFLLETQRSIARENSVVMDGRDIGTVILPDADVKIFLIASNEARAARRYAELWQKGINTSYEAVLAAMNERDKNDSTREIAPAVPADDAIMLDNSGLTREETISRAIEIIDGKIKG